MTEKTRAVLTGRRRRSGEGPSRPRRIEQLLYRLKGAGVIGNVLHVGTHPDDEDAGLMAFMAHKYGARIAYWSATRGEGGQNRLGPYTGEALGVYRTWESLAARAIDGGESLFGPFIDFGYSKNGPEATAKWGHRELVREIVRAIRLVQPQILIARYKGDATDGHGQHQAIGLATPEAFDAAADPALFPELGLPAWRTLKLYQSMGGDWQPGEETGLGLVQPQFERDGFLRVDTGELDAIAGATYQQQAWTAFNCHQTQGMGFLPEGGSFFYYYRLRKSHVATTSREESFYDGLDPTLPGLALYPGGGPPGLRDTLQATLACIRSALSQFHPDDPAKAVGPLVDALDLLRRLRIATDNAHALTRQLDDKIELLEDVIVGCLGIDAECSAERAHVVAGETIRVRGRLWNPRGVRIDDSRFGLHVPDGWTVLETSAPDETEVEFHLLVAPHAQPTTPYWLRDAHDGYRFRVPVDSFACEALGPAPVTLECELLVDGRLLTLRRPALRREPFAGGYRELPIAVLPEVSVRTQVSRIFLPAGASSYEIDLHVAVHRHVSQSSTTTRLRVAAPAGWTVSPPLELPAGRQGTVTPAEFQVTVPDQMPAGRYRLEYLLGPDSGTPAMTLEPVWMGAPGLPRPSDAATCIREAFLARPAHVDLHMISARLARGLKYGYIRGVAEGLLDALNNFGLSIHVISDEEILHLDLSAFDAIIVGPNAYLLREVLRRNALRLLEYVAKGGTLIVQYQAYGYELHDFTPYPFDYSHPHDRVTYPGAPMTILEPEHPLVTHPNRLVQEDFEGWVHDRGLYFFGTFDSRYTPILGCNDPGEALKTGGLVYARYGRGAFVYVGYSLFRQIPAAVPGAFRLLANLLALPEALLLERIERLKTMPLFASMTAEKLKAVAKIVSER